MASNGDRRRMRHTMWQQLREIGGSEVEIMQDPLGVRYTVNKFGIHARGDIETINDTYHRFLALLSIHGSKIEHKHGDAYVSPMDSDILVVVSKPSPHPGGLDESILRISIN